MNHAHLKYGKCIIRRYHYFLCFHSNCCSQACCVYHMIRSVRLCGKIIVIATKLIGDVCDFNV